MRQSIRWRNGCEIRRGRAGRSVFSGVPGQALSGDARDIASQGIYPPAGSCPSPAGPEAAGCDARALPPLFFLPPGSACRAALSCGAAVTPPSMPSTSRTPVPAAFDAPSGGRIHPSCVPAEYGRVHGSIRTCRKRVRGSCSRAFYIDGMAWRKNSFRNNFRIF